MFRPPLGPMVVGGKLFSVTAKTNDQSIFTFTTGSGSINMLVWRYAPFLRVLQLLSHAGAVLSD